MKTRLVKSIMAPLVVAFALLTDGCRTRHPGRAWKAEDFKELGRCR